MGEYLVQVYLRLREGKPVVGARLAEQLGVTAPAVTQTLRRLARDKLITADRRTGVQLTPEGKALAEATVRRHYLIEHLLVDLLGLKWTEVHQEANRLEHALSAELEEKLRVKLGNPTTCPHGNPFPGSPDEARLVASPTLAQAREGQGVTLLRITEEAEEDMDLMRYLWAHRVVPGVRLRVLRRDPQTGAFTLLKGERTTLSLPLESAEKLRIAPP